MSDGCTCPMGEWYTELCDYCLDEAAAGRPVGTTRMSYEEAVRAINEIYRILLAPEWGPDTLEAIATTIRNCGLNNNPEEGN